MAPSSEDPLERTLEQHPHDWQRKSRWGDRVQGVRESDVGFHGRQLHGHRTSLCQHGLDSEGYNDFLKGLFDADALLMQYITFRPNWS